MYKNYTVARIKTGEILESFSSMEAAEKFMIMMQSKGENVQIKTDTDDVDDTNPGFEIGDMQIDEPNIEFGSALDEFNDDRLNFEFED